MYPMTMLISVCVCCIVSYVPSSLAITIFLLVNNNSHLGRTLGGCFVFVPVTSLNWGVIFLHDISKETTQKKTLLYLKDKGGRIKSIVTTKYIDCNLIGYVKGETIICESLFP